MGSERSEGNSI